MSLIRWWEEIGTEYIKENALKIKWKMLEKFYEKNVKTRTIDVGDAG